MPVPTARNAGIAMLLHDGPAASGGRRGTAWWDRLPAGPAVTPRRPFSLAIMLLSCHPPPMANLQVKNIPDDLHDRLRAYARESNSTISRGLVVVVHSSSGAPAREIPWHFSLYGTVCQLLSACPESALPHLLPPLFASVLLFNSLWTVATRYPAAARLGRALQRRSDPFTRGERWQSRCPSPWLHRNSKAPERSLRGFAIAVLALARARGDQRYAHAGPVVTAKM